MATLYLDASFDSSKFRSEFRFPKANKVYKTDMRLLNVGLEKTNAGDTSYNILVGGYVIDSISLYSGSQLIDQVQNFSSYVALKNLLNKNADNQSNQRPLVHNKLGYMGKGQNVYIGGTNGYKITNKVPDNYNQVFGSDATSENKVRNGAWLDLKQCLGFLRDSPYIPMNVFGDLRLQIDYKRDMSNYVADSTATLETIEPLIICEYEPDAMVADALMKSYTGTTFETIEYDSVRLPEVALTQDEVETQEESFLVKGMNGKRVSKMVIVNTPTDQTTWRNAGNNSPMGPFGSVSQLDWSVQARVNGSNLFPNSLLEGKNRQLAKMVDAWGDMNLVVGQQLCAIKSAADAYDTSIEDTVGQVSYVGYRIDDVIQELKLTVQRSAVGPDATAANNARLRQALRLNMYAMSRKRVVPMSNGQILVQYV